MNIHFSWYLSGDVLRYTQISSNIFIRKFFKFQMACFLVFVISETIIRFIHCDMFTEVTMNFDPCQLELVGAVSITYSWCLIEKGNSNFQRVYWCDGRWTWSNDKINTNVILHQSKCNCRGLRMEKCCILFQIMFVKLNRKKNT